jgi:hypothetical protein
MGLFVIQLSAQESQLAVIEDIYPEEINFAGFRLNSEQKVSIDAAVLSSRWNYRDYSFSYAWILDAATRRVVWQIDDAEMHERNRPITIFNDELSLPAGVYEVYYSSYPYYVDYNHGDGFFSGLFGLLFDHDELERYFEDDFEELYIRVSGSGESLSKDEILDRQKQLQEDALLSLVALRDDEDFDQYFEVTEPVNLEIYALGEARRDGNYDFGWIVNTKTREKTWLLDYRKSKHAGGSLKNRVVNSTIDFEPGTYQLLFVTDDSHSFRQWNAPPPFDPNFWGVTLGFANPEDASKVRLLDEAPQKNAIIEFNRIRDDEYISEGFTLKKPLDLHVYALGEGRDDEMFDYGWIVNAKTRETVWKMKYHLTEHAGGASKNRLFDEIVHFEPGNYIAYYVTDDSHSYHSWNDGAPINSKKWGMTITVADESFRDGDVVAYVEEEDESVLVKLTRIGDHDRRRAKFTLTEEQNVQIYSIGEGTRGDMYDYAWIEEANTGRIVWEMTYHKTERAGGARKNRLFNDVIELPAGEYYVIYETDDSHSFGDWNASPPDDPINYGITITKSD